MRASKIVFNTGAALAVVGAVGSVAMYVSRMQSGMSSEQIFASKGFFPQAMIAALLPVSLFVLLPISLWLGEREKKQNPEQRQE